MDINSFLSSFTEIFYRYSAPDYSITDMPLSWDDCKLIKKAITLLKNMDKENNSDVAMVLAKVQDRLTSILNFV